MENPQQNSEEGLMPKSSPPQPNPAIVANEAGQGSGFPESDKSSATPVVVLSTLVAICGSFAYGCTVSSIPLSSYMFLFLDPNLAFKCFFLSFFILWRN